MKLEKNTGARAMLEVEGDEVLFNVTCAVDVGIDEDEEAEVVVVTNMTSTSSTSTSLAPVFFPRFITRIKTKDQQIILRRSHR